MILFSALGAAFALGGVCIPQQTGVETVGIVDFAVRQWRSTPKMQIDDAYKWLFHATLGGEHAVTDEAGPRSWLEAEWNSLVQPLSGEPAAVRLTPDGSLLRVNLRPYKNRGGDHEMLLALFVASARRFHAEKRRFVCAWMALGDRLARRPLGKITHRDWLSLDRRAMKLGYPAWEHSRAYEQAYKPAYRVVLGSMWAG